MPKSLPMGRFKWLDPAKFSLDKYHDNSSKDWILEVHYEYLKELLELRNDYHVVPSKLKLK